MAEAVQTAICETDFTFGSWELFRKRLNDLPDENVSDCVGLQNAAAWAVKDSSISVPFHPQECLVEFLVDGYFAIALTLGATHITEAIAFCTRPLIGHKDHPGLQLDVLPAQASQLPNSQAATSEGHNHVGEPAQSSPFPAMFDHGPHLCGMITVGVGSLGLREFQLNLASGSETLFADQPQDDRLDQRGL